MAVNDIGRVTPRWKGEYAAGKTYELNDIVTRGSSVFWHRLDAGTAGRGPEDETVWALVIDGEAVDANVDRAVEEAADAVSAAQAAAEVIEAAKGEAETAAQSATASAAAAVQSSNQAGAYATSAQNASASAIEANDAAQEAKTAAEAAQEAAETARGEAETAKTAASESASAAASSQKTIAEAEARILPAVEDGIDRITAKGEETLATIPDDYTELYDYSLLHVDEINDTEQIIVFAADGSVDRVEHTRSGGVVRADVFTFTNDAITETRTLSGGASLTMTTDLKTLRTTVVYTAA